MTEPTTLELLDAEISDLCSVYSVIWAITRAQEKLTTLRERLQWRDIATAPKDETEILLFTPGAKPEFVIGKWMEFESVSTGQKWGWWNYAEAVLSAPFGEIEAAPTYWMPLPDAPAMNEPP